MNISKYEFHDGSVIDIKHHGNKIEISMESAEICEGDLKDDVILSEHFTLKGILHLDGVNFIKENHEKIKVLEKKFDTGEILDLEIKNNKVKMFLNWINFPPKSCIEEYNTIEIEAEKMWWENIPDLFDPHW